MRKRDVTWQEKLEYLLLYQCRLFQKVFVRRQVLLVIPSEVGRHGLLDSRWNSKKDGQADEIRDRCKHTFSEFKISNENFFVPLRENKNENIRKVENSVSIVKYPDEWRWLCKPGKPIVMKVRSLQYIH